VPPERFLHCISNHDQAGNRAMGDRLNHAVSPEAYRAASALLCLSPYLPMLFMGQEWAALTPFLFFTDHHEKLGKLVTKGRRREFEGFAAFSDPAQRRKIPDPQAMETFRRSQLNWSEPESAEHAPVLALYRECLALRFRHPVFRPATRDTWQVERVGGTCGAIVYRGGTGERWLVLFELREGGRRVRLADEWVAKLPDGGRWRTVLSSNESRFGGNGAAFDALRQEARFDRPELLVLRSKMVSSPPPS
jgi:maltooligosyltrehalose trehalohydrolase